MDVLDLLFRRLVLAARAAGALERPVEVGELLDAFVPYRSARRDGMLATNDDYLHAVMRLVSGERDFIFADDLMQDDLKAELTSPLPDLAVLRTYKNAKLRLSTAGVQRVLEEDVEIDLRPPTPTPAAGQQTSSRPAPTAPAAAPRPNAAVAPAPTPVYSEAQLGEADIPNTGCPYCANALPEGRPVKFCPACGQNLLVRRCQGCSAEVEAEWKFCVTCGRKAS